MFSCTNENSCKAFRGLLVDKQTDTVKVNVGILAPAVEKENQAPDLETQRHREEQKRVRSVEEQQRLADETKRLEQEADERRFRQEHVEQLRLAQIEKHRNEEWRRIEEEQRAQVKEQERLLAEEFRKHEFRKQQLQAEQQAQLEEQCRLETAQKQEMLSSFLTSAGFTDVNAKKKEKSGMFSSGFTYPIHAAVKANDVDIVQLLIEAGADRTVSNSKKVTPLMMAQKLDKRGSHRLVIAILSA
jgi:superfamily II RNA helicase